MRTPPAHLPALITPFTRSGELDDAAHAGNIALLTERGVRGFLLAGSTGEGPYLEPGERTRLVEGARSAAPRAFLLCGIASESLRGAIRQAAEAEAGGADAVLVLTPTSLVRGRHQRVREYFSDLSARSPIPVFLYSVPNVTGYELPVEDAVGLSHLDNVAGMKDSGGHPVRVASIIRGAPDRFFMFTGSSAAVSLSVSSGARGAITASANYAPQLVEEIANGGRRSPGRVDAAQARLVKLAKTVEAHGAAGSKAAAGLVGLETGSPRKPLRAVTPAVRNSLATALREAGITVTRTVK
jgi:dihydrodipicolinate synthase/N-acetylneuraminate lyase